MIRKQFVFFVFALVFSVIFSRPALANDLSTASATVDCNGFSLSVNAINLTVGASYTINFTFTLTPTAGAPITVPGSITFTATSTSATKTASGSWPSSPLTANFTVSGSAVLTTSGSMTTIKFNGANSLALTCGGTGCPATPGFWKNDEKHPFPDSVQTSGLTIGGVSYSASDLLTILNNNGGNAVAILGRQLVAALVNLAAGAKHNSTADAAITTAEALLKANNLNLLTSDVDPSTTLGQALLATENTLDMYNNANFHSCSEGSGLVLGSTP